MCDYNIDPQGDVILTLTNPNAPIPFCKPNLWFGIAPSHASVTFLVSSRHLVLASPVFKAMLTGGWSEGDKKDGQYNIRAEGWDTEAFRTVMNVLHGRYRQVYYKNAIPNTLETLVRIGAIVDYYKIHEAFEPMAFLWTRTLKFMAPSVSFSPEDILWIMISWVFKDGETFRQTTKAAILWGKGDIMAQGLPIPPPIIDRINQRRKESLDAIAAALQNLQKDYAEGREGCSFECSAIQLGALTKNMHDLDLVGHGPKSPFGGGVCVVEVVEKIKDMKSPTWHTAVSRSARRGLPAHARTSESTWEEHQCLQRERSDDNVIQPGVGSTTRKALADLPRHLSVCIKDKIEGLCLADFTSDDKKE